MKVIENPTPEQKAEFYKALGVPDSPDAYVFDEPQLPEGMQRDENLLTAFKSKAHELNMPATQAKDLQAWYNQQQIEQHKMIEKATKDNFDNSVTELRKEWPGEKFEANTALAKRAVETLGGEDFKNFLKDYGINNNPMMVKVFHNIATKIGDDSLVPGTPDQADTGRPTSPVTGKPLLKFKPMGNQT